MKPDTSPLDPDVVRQNAGVGPIGRRVLVFRETASTNELAMNLGESGEEEGIVIFAESQTAGRGQFRRPWHSAPGLGLWFSILLRPRLPKTEVTRLTSFTAVCVAEAVAAATGVALRIKPPNDLYGTLGKAAGILIETRTGSNAFAVLGVGLNVNHLTTDFPPELQQTASSLAMEAGSFQDRLAVAVSVLREMNGRWDELHEDVPSYEFRYRQLLREEDAGALHSAKV